MLNKTNKILIFIIIAALLFRFVLLITTWQTQGSGGITDISVGVAKNIASGYGFSILTKDGLKPSNYELPGYPLYLSSFILLFGTDLGLWIARTVQILISSILGVILCFYIGRRLFNNGTGLLFGGLWAVFLPEALLSTYVLHDSLMPVIVLCSTYFFTEAILKHRKKYYIISAIAIGIGSLIRTDILLLPTFFLLSLFILNIKEWKKHLKNFVIMVCVILMILLPWGTRNYLHFNKFSITRSVFWQAIWEGFGEFPNPFGAVQDDTITAKRVIDEYGPIDGMSDQFQQIMKRKSLTALQQHPLWFIKMLPKRLVNMILIGGGAHGHEIFSQDPYYHYASSYKIINPNGNVFGYVLFLLNKPYELLVRTIPILYRSIFLFFALTGIIIWRKKWRKLFLILSVYAYGTFSHLLIYWEPRYLVPTEFPILLPAALALYTIATHVLSHPPKKFEATN